MFFTLASTRYDIDDSFYVNMGVAAADFPSQPLLRFDTIHGIGLPFQEPYYRVHTFELLAGLITHAFGVETIRVIHAFKGKPWPFQQTSRPNPFLSNPLKY